MIRATLLLGFGIGYVAAPDLTWLVAIALAAVLRPGWWPRKPAARIVQIGTVKGRHYHYCKECDRQWAHAGEGTRCTEHWAGRCPECRAGTGTARSA